MENLQFLKDIWQEVDAPHELNLSNIRSKGMAAVKKANQALKRSTISLVLALVIMIAVWVFIPFPTVLPKIFLGLTMALMISFAFIYDHNRKKNERLDPSLSPEDYLEEMKGFLKRKKLIQALTLSLYLPMLFVFILNYLLTLGFFKMSPLAFGVMLSALLVGNMILITVAILRYKKTSSKMDEIIVELSGGEDDLEKGMI